MGKLDKTLGYLSGPMEYVKDYGVEWRSKFIQTSYEVGLKLDFIDPTNKPGGQINELAENQEYQQMLQKEGRFEELQAFVKKYRRFDLTSTDRADFLVVNVHPTVPQWGTSNELYVAESEHKPVFFFCHGGLYNLPRWLFDVVELDCIFENYNDIIERLLELDSGKRELCEKWSWVGVRKYLEENRKWV